MSATYHFLGGSLAGYFSVRLRLTLTESFYCTYVLTPCSQDEPDPALAAYRAAMKLWPASHVPPLAMATLCLRTGQLVLAQQYAHLAMARCGGDPLVYHELGAMAYKLGESARGHNSSIGCVSWVNSCFLSHTVYRHATHSYGFTNRPSCYILTPSSFRCRRHLFVPKLAASCNRPHCVPPPPLAVDMGAHVSAAGTRIQKGAVSAVYYTV